MKTLLVLLAAAATMTMPVTTVQDSPLADVLNAMSFRNVGPFRTSAWITEIAVPEAPLHDHLYTIYAAARSGGLWKTTNNGITWQAISDSVEVAAVGAVALSPSNPDIVWMGTGANDLARSSYSGKGVYKSTDAGETWQFMGLADSHHIARIVVHPTDPDTVWVAAMGHLFSRNAERGVLRTRNGGETWEKVLYIDDGTGAVDLVINPESPDTLFAAMYEKHRTPWHLILGGPGSGVYRTDDGGTTWEQLEGLPSGDVGRVSTITGLLHLGRLRVLLKSTLKGIAIADIRDRSSLKERIEIGTHRWSLFFAMACLLVAGFISSGPGSA